MKTYLIDLDGTMYRGNKNIEGTHELIQDCLEKKVPFYFLTNNATRTRKENAEHMLKLGFEGIQPEHFYTSSMAAIHHVAQLSGDRHAYYIGQAGLKEAFDEGGFIYDDQNPTYVFVGLDTAGNYQLYSQALHYLLNGAQLVGTNNDRRLPHGDRFNVGNGAIVAMLEYASGQTSIKIGKPHKAILVAALEHFSLKKEEVILIGDNLETDIQLGINCDVETIFIDTGVHTFEDIEKLQIFPSKKIHSLSELIKKD